MLARLARTIPIALVFAALLQWGAASAQQPVAPTTPSAPAGLKTNDDASRAAEGILATILQSGSTNTRAYKVTIHNDGSAKVEFNDPRSDSQNELAQGFPAGTVDVATLQRLLIDIGDVSRIRTGECAKSTSFGTRTQISYAGKTSGDLQCILHESLGGDQLLLHSSEELGQLVQSVLGQLKIDSHRMNSNQ
jgi:hypothetical protein